MPTQTITYPASDFGAIFPGFALGQPPEATGDENDPIWLVRTVDMLGNLITNITTAVDIDQVTWTLNAPDECTFHFSKNSGLIPADVQVLGDGASNVCELQVLRNGALLFWGPIVKLDGAGSRATIDCSAMGPEWYLNRRFADGPITNLLTNPDFESNLDDWATGTLFTASPDGDNFIMGTQSAFISGNGGDQYLEQTAQNQSNGIGQKLTLSGWFYINEFTEVPYQTRGLYVAGFHNGVFKGDNYFPIDNATQRKKWTKASCTISIPPNEVWDFKVRCYTPIGSINWDDIKLVSYDSLSTATLENSATAPVDIARIAALLVRHMQDNAFGKSHLQIGTNTATTGVKIAKTWQFVDHIQFDQAMSELLERADGIDYHVEHTPTTRTFRTFAGKRGTDRSDDVTLAYVAGNDVTTNCADYRFSQDGGACITRQIVLGEDNGPTREQGESVDISQNGGITLQNVKQAPQGTEVASLQPLADEQVTRFARPPASIEMDLLAGAGLFNTIHVGDLVNVDIQDGYVFVGTTLRIMKLVLDRKTNVMTVTLAVDTL